LLFDYFQAINYFKKKTIKMEENSQKKISPTENSQNDEIILPVSKGRGAKWHPLEDVELCKSWVEISEDPVTGKEQKNTKFWERITENYHKKLDKNFPPRTSISLTSRWSNVRKF
jgi:hypothetical protein